MWMKYGEKSDRIGVWGPETNMVVSSLGFLFASHIPDLELEKMAI